MIEIAGVVFDGLAAPESFSLGGEHKIVIKEMPGGSVILQPRGYFQKLNNEWEGLLHRPDAMDVAYRFDDLNSKLQPITVRFGKYAYVCLISRWEWDWMADDRVAFKITLTRDNTAKSKETTDPLAAAYQAAVAQSESVPTEEKTHVVQPGESLWRIAQAYYGDGAQLEKIYKANREVIGLNPSLIKVGMRLVIPS